ncbi:MAG: hypothetical protein ACJAU6_001314 [Alphaproteobacteria bacterium]|jgi:D-proline reductase (dithiol) PrdB
MKETVMTGKDSELNFAEPHDTPVPYRERITSYYLALGYDKPYQWAHFNDVPFTPLQKPLAESRVALITTAAPYQDGKGDQGPGAPYNAAAKFYKVYSGDVSNDHDLRVSHIGIDRNHTTAEDMNTYFPLKQFRKLAESGRIGSMAPRFHGAPTNRSQETTIDQDAAEILARLREDKADAAVIVAN